MDKSELIKKLRAVGPQKFVESNLFDSYSWYQSRSSNDYDDLRKYFSEVFRNEPSDIAIVGSGKYGFSLSPEKDFRAFQHSEPDASDLDMVVISRPIFNDTWHHLRRAHYNGAINASKFYQDSVFKRFITVGTDSAQETRYLKDLISLLNSVRKVATTRLGITQVIKLRVYHSWSDAKAYHIWSLQKLGERNGF